MVKDYEWIWNPKMSPEEFEEANTSYLQELWLEDYPHLAHMMNDGDLSHYIEHIDWDWINEKMIDLYAVRIGNR